MGYPVVQDAPKPRYMVVTIYTEYDPATVELFITKEAALASWEKHSKNSESYISELLGSNTGEVDPPPSTGIAANWEGCCSAAGEIADLVCFMFYQGEKAKQARKTWPTSTWAEIIARNVGVETPE